MHLERATSATEELHLALKRLIPQLTANHAPPSQADLAALIGSGSARLLIVRYPDEHGPIVGTANLTLYLVPTGLRAILEDVVVDEQLRGRGIGEALVRYALDLSRDAGARGVSLTSNSKRVAANQLYQKLGFLKRNTNSYYYDLEGSGTVRRRGPG
jgi:ribosomal protein S18 acetylase RimI-like enzyme